MVYKYTSSKEVIAKIYSDLDVQEELHRITDIREWIAEAVEKVGAFEQFVKKVKKLPIKDYKVRLPENFHDLIQCAYSFTGCDDHWAPMRVATGSFDCWDADPKWRHKWHNDRGGILSNRDIVGQLLDLIKEIYSVNRPLTDNEAKDIMMTLSHGDLYHYNTSAHKGPHGRPGDHVHHHGSGDAHPGGPFHSHPPHDCKGMHPHLGDCCDRDDGPHCENCVCSKCHPPIPPVPPDPDEPRPEPPVLPMPPEHHHGHEHKHQYRPGHDMVMPVLLSMLNTNVVPAGFNERNITPKTKFEPVYILNGGFINTNIRHGYILLSYNAIPVDDEGFPLIPDSAAYKEAIYWYVTMKLKFPEFLAGRLHGNVYAEIKNNWHIYCKQAYGEAVMPNRDKMQSLQNQWLRLVPEIHEHGSFFKTSGQEQDIYNQNNRPSTGHRYPII